MACQHRLVMVGPYSGEGEQQYKLCISLYLLFTFTYLFCDASIQIYRQAFENTLSIIVNLCIFIVFNCEIYKFYNIFIHFLYLFII